MYIYKTKYDTNIPVKKWTYTINTIKSKVRCINNKVHLQHYLKHYSFRLLHSIIVPDPYPSVPKAMTSSAMSQPMTASDEFNTHKRTHWAPMLQVGFGVKSQTLVLGCIWVYSSHKNSPENKQRHITNTDKIQQNAHGHSTSPTRSFIHHSFIHSFIHSFTSHHSCITHSSHTASYYASPIHHTASQRIIPCITHSSHCISTHHTNKTLYTTNHTDICA